MSAPRPGHALKAHSLRESLAKTVKLLTKSGIDVNFRGHVPHVRTNGKKAVALVLPELNDDADPRLIEAIQGFLDHEVGHIYYTPFDRAGKFYNSDKKRHSLLNIVEDIRLEKLLPRDLPGTKENIERMHVKSIPFYFAPGCLQAASDADASVRFNGCLVVGLRALGGQKEFQKFMDDNNLWPHLKPLLVKMPDLSRRLRSMETYDEVEAIVEDMIKATTPPPPPPAPPPPPPPAPTDCSSDEDEETDQESAGSGEDEPEDENEGGDDADQGDEGDPDDSETDDKDSGGKGHGDGAGEDDEEEDEEEGACSGDADDDAADDGDDAGDKERDRDSGEGDDAADDDGAGSDHANDGETDAPLDKLKGGDGKNSTTLTDALKQLDPDQRKAIFLYKKRKQTVAEIAGEMQLNEDEVLDLLRNARKRLGELLSGR